MKLLKLYFSVVMIVILSACNSQVKNGIDKNIIESENNVTQAQEQTSDVVELKGLQLIDRTTRIASVIDDEAVIQAVSKAWSTRERSYEKLMPMFEFAIKFEHEGKEELWRINKAGYCMKEGSSELYKVDTKILETLM